MSVSPPSVSICIPTYNRSHYLTYAVESVLNQTYSDFELLVCDDASTDRTPEVAERWQDPRIRYIRRPQNLGPIANMRSGFELAQGKYFIKIDDDDALRPEFLAQTVAILEADASLDFVSTQRWIIDAGSNRVTATNPSTSALPEGKISHLLEESFTHQHLQAGSTLFRKTALAAIDYLRPQANGCEDFDLLVRLAMAGKQGYFLPHMLTEYRFHGCQTNLRQTISLLSARAFCLSSYQFPDQPLEQLRQQKLAQTHQLLGLRLIERGETEKGRYLLQTASQTLGLSFKVRLGMLLGYLPLRLRQRAFQIFYPLHSRDSLEQMRPIG